MTAREWLYRGWKLDREITALTKMRDETWERVTALTANHGGVVVQGYKDPHKYEKLAELDEKIDKHIDALVDVKRQIVDLIGEIEDSRYRTLLLERYTRFKTWEQIAVDMHYSYRQICRMHGEALGAAERALAAFL